MAVLFAMRRAKLSRLQGDEPRRGGGGLTPTGTPPEAGTVPNLGDLTTDEYSFVIKCTASPYLPVRTDKPFAAIDCKSHAAYSHYCVGQ